jgi:hypothetical protein
MLFAAGKQKERNRQIGRKKITYNVFVKFHDSVKNLAFNSLKPTE